MTNVEKALQIEPRLRDLGLAQIGVSAEGELYTVSEYEVNLHPEMEQRLIEWLK